jgi:hypothetical protein
MNRGDQGGLRIARGEAGGFTAHETREAECCKLTLPEQATPPVCLLNAALSVGVSVMLGYVHQLCGCSCVRAPFSFISIHLLRTTHAILVQYSSMDYINAAVFCSMDINTAVFCSMGTAKIAKMARPWCVMHAAR